MTRLLIVEDDEPVRNALQEGFQFEGYEVDTAADGEAALSAVTSLRPDLLVLDVMLPKLSGIDVCRQLRARGDTVPIIMLTARREETEKVRALQLGADDYVTKPFGFQELAARVEAVLRRTRPAAQAEPLQLGAIEIRFDVLEARRGDELVDLSPREFNLLRYLSQRPLEVVRRDELLRSVWGYDESFPTRTVDMHIAKLRRKIEADPANPRFILTVHGSGYQFVPRPA